MERNLGSFWHSSNVMTFGTTHCRDLLQQLFDIGLPARRTNSKRRRKDSCRKAPAAVLGREGVRSWQTKNTSTPMTVLISPQRAAFHGWLEVRFLRAAGR